MDNPGQMPAQGIPQQSYNYQYQQPQAAYPPQPAQSYPPPPAQPGLSPQAQNPAQFGIRVVDSLTANEFRVEINGQTVTGIFSVSGIVPFSIKVDETGKPVGINSPPLTITKMVQQDPNLPFNAWVREAVQARGSVLPTREIAIVALDEGVETRRWVYHNAWICEVLFSDFDTASEFLVEEKVVIRHGGVEELWPNR
jgi:hypothetical protein